MNKNPNAKKGFIHLYNPKTEGLGSYDVHYINAQKHHQKIKKLHKQSDRSAA